MAFIANRDALFQHLLTLMCVHVRLCAGTYTVWRSKRKFALLLEIGKLYVSGSGKTGLIATITDNHFLPVRESCTHALPRNTKYLIIDGQVYFTDGFLPMLSNHQGAFHGPGGH